MQTDPFIVGVDVSKDTLACCVNGVRHELANSKAAIAAWLRQLPARSVVAMESTGRYHQTLAALAYAAGMRVYVLNSMDVFFYAKALGTRGKTDPRDAAVIARYVAEHVRQLHAWTPATPAQQQLQDLVRHRAGITTHRAALRQMASHVPSLRPQFEHLQDSFELLLASIDSQLQELIAADQDMKQADAALQTITGIKLQGSALLISLLSRIRFANVDALVAYSGMDPRANDSGHKRGTRRLSKKGPPELRRQLYLAAFSATRSATFKPLYQALLVKGFKSTEAFVILARKILRIAWAVWNSRKPFDPRLANPHMA